MKFDYLVKHNGIYYPAGTDVPIETSGGGEVAPTVNVSGKVDTDEIQANSDKAFAEFDSKRSKRKYTEEELDLPYMKLKSLATKEGFKVDRSAKAEEIKEMLRSL